MMKIKKITKPKYVPPEVKVYGLNDDEFITARNQMVRHAKNKNAKSGGRPSVADVLKKHNLAWEKLPIKRPPMREELGAFLNILDAEKGLKKGAISLARWGKFPIEIREYFEGNRYITKFRKGDLRFMGLSHEGVVRFVELEKAVKKMPI